MFFTEDLGPQGVRLNYHLPQTSDHDEDIQPCPGPILSKKELAAIGCKPKPELQHKKRCVEVQHQLNEQRCFSPLRIHADLQFDADKQGVGYDDQREKAVKGGMIYNFLCPAPLCSSSHLCRMDPQNDSRSSSRSGFSMYIVFSNHCSRMPRAHCILYMRSQKQKDRIGDRR